MSVASHLRIRLADYDRAIRTLIPDYDETLAAAAGALSAVRRRAPTVIDLGIGTGALAARCLALSPAARVIGIDADPEILALARERLRARRAAHVALVHASFETTALAACDAIVASYALHHVPTTRRKRALYRRCHAALRPGGILINADCCPPGDWRLAAAGHAAWREHVTRTHGAGRMRAFFRSWGQEDVYFSLGEERSMLRAAGFAADVVWRRGCFAVVVGRKRQG